MGSAFLFPIPVFPSVRDSGWCDSDCRFHDFAVVQPFLSGLSKGGLAEWLCSFLLQS